MKSKLTNSATFINFLGRLFSAMIIIALIVPGISFSQNGNPVSIASNNQTIPVMTTDGSGGTIIAWQDNHNGKNEIFAQRMNADGNPVWTTNGVEICTQDSSYKPMIIPDGLGGAIIAWQSYRGSNTSDIYAQRVNSS